MRILDGTTNKHVLGANAILGVSLACAHAGARRANTPLYEHIRNVFGLTYKDFRVPTPFLNVFNGGLHADTNLDMQEFIIIPHGFTRFARKLQAGSEIFTRLVTCCMPMDSTPTWGTRVGMHRTLAKTEMALEYLVKAVKKAKYKLGTQVGFGIDVAASEFYDAKKDRYIFEDGSP